tara:strand:+ start:505 stop:1182 length:678 start_codon:yes stop_codon:yes gene_type:complete
MKNSIEISKKIQKDTENICLKFNFWMNEYTNKIEDSNLKIKIVKQTDALLFKFISIGINLEHLWEIRYEKKCLFREKNTNTKEWENPNSFIDLVFLENTVIQVRSFIDFAQKLSCLVLGYEKNFIGTKGFYKVLNKIDNDKAKKILNKFQEILTEGNWGSTVKSIRDKISHYDIIKTNSEYLPVIQKMNYEDFCQNLENNVFVLLCDLNEILFEKKWVAGYVNYI